LLTATEMQKEYRFAVLDDESTRFKIIVLKEWRNNGFRHTLEPCPRDDSSHLNWTLARDTNTNLQELTLSDGKLFLWRTPWTVCHKNEWIPILDSDDRGRLPGSFFYVGLANPSRIMQQKQIRANIMRMLCVRPQPQLEQRAGIPSFVANIMKQDAIRNRAQCPISMEPITEATRASLTSCYHIFEAENLNDWLQRNPSCPLCKKPVASTTLC
jgi:hypothetical protein